METYCLITFANTHSAMTASKSLEKIFAITIMPTLREISQSCGIAVRFALEDLEVVRTHLEETDLAEGMYQFYKVTKTENQNQIEKLC